MRVIELDKVTRITIVPDKEPVIEKWGLFENGVELHLQDDGRTLKIFPRQEEKEGYDID